MFAALEKIDGIDIPPRKQAEFYVGSSIQFKLKAVSASDIPDFLTRCAAREVELKWFGADQPVAFTSRYDSWQYIPDLPDLPATKAALAKTVDMRIPLTFDVADCQIITQIIGEEMVDLSRRLDRKARTKFLKKPCYPSRKRTPAFMPQGVLPPLVGYWRRYGRNQNR